MQAGCLSVLLLVIILLLQLEVHHLLLGLLLWLHVVLPRLLICGLAPPPCIHCLSPLGKRLLQRLVFVCCILGAQWDGLKGIMLLRLISLACMLPLQQACRGDEGHQDEQAWNAQAPGKRLNNEKCAQFPINMLSSLQPVVSLPTLDSVANV